MGVSLTFCPLLGRGQLADSKITIIDQLEVPQDHDLYAQLKRDGFKSEVEQVVHPQPLPTNISVQLLDENEGLIETRTDGMGWDLTFVFADQLRAISLPADSNARMKAVFAFVGALDPDTPIILYWH